MDLQTTWGILPAVYLFLGGLSAGAFCATSVLYLKTERHFSRTIQLGAWVAFAALVIGLIFLVAETSKPFQAMVLFKSFVNFGSWMTIGAWLLFAAIIVFAIYALIMTDGLTKKLGTKVKVFADEKRVAGIRKAVSVIGVPFALGVAVYTGVLLSAAPSIPLWNSWLLPVLFTVSALDTGIAAVVLCTFAETKTVETGKLHTVIESVVIGLVTLEAIVVVAFFLVMQQDSAAAALSIDMMLSGPLSIAFWSLFVAVGLIVPFLAGAGSVIGSRKGAWEKSSGKAIAITGAVGALVGGFVLRSIILSAGIHNVLMSPDIVQAVNGVFMVIS